MTQTSLCVFVAFHDSMSKRIAELIAAQRPYFHLIMMHPHVLFESQFYLGSLPETYITKFDYVGLISYSFPQKMKIDESQVANFIERVVREGRGCDVVPLKPSALSGIKSIVVDGHLGHGPDFVKCWDALLTRMAFEHNDVHSPRHPIFYLSCWLARPQLMMDYMRFVQAAFAIVQSDSYVSSCFKTDAKWTSKLNRQQLMSIFDKPYYMMHPFIFERLPGFYFSMRKCNYSGRGMIIHSRALIVIIIAITIITITIKHLK